jgi:HEAT repeat protein
MNRVISVSWLVTLVVVFQLATLPPVRSAQDFSGQQLEHYLNDLSSEDDFIVYAAVWALGDIGSPAIPPLIELFKTEQLQLRYWASEALSSVGETAAPALLEALNSDVPQVRWMAAFTLGKDRISESFIYAESIHYALLEALQDPDPRVRIMASNSLWEYTDESAMPAFLEDDRDKNLSPLVKALRHPEKDVRLEAAHSLVDIVESNPLFSRDIAADLTLSMTDPNPSVRAIAAHTLGQMGAQADVAISELMQALKDPDPLVRGSAARALGAIGEPAKGAIPRLQDLLDDPNQDARGGAAAGLAALGDHSERVIVELREDLKDVDEDTRELAAMALGAIGVAAKVTVPDLRELMSDIFPEVRRAVAQALGRIGETASAASPELVRGLTDRDPLVRNYSAQALGRIGNAAESAVPQLRQSLKDRDPTVRASAARSLGQIGLQADDVIQDLNKTLEDPSSLARKFSAEALAKISVSIKESASGLTSRELDKAIADLEITKGHLQTAAAASAENKSEYNNALNTVDLAIDALNVKKYGIFYQLKENWIIVLVVVYVFLLPLFWRLLLWLRPLWLFRINHALAPYEFAAPRVLSDKNRISTRYIILVGFYYFHPRVLDAWVESELGTIRSAFENKFNIKSHSVHVPLPVEMDGEIVPSLTRDDLVPIFSRPTSCVLIWGQGGVGKMNSATQIAHLAMARDKSQRLCSHPMIPIVIDRKFGSGAKDRNEKKKGGDNSSSFKNLIEVARGQLQNLMRAPEPLSQDVINALLKRPSILLVTHDLSEKNSATRDQIRPDLPDFPANALLVTSRTEDSLGEVMKTTIRPLMIGADQYQSFLEKYVSEVDESAQFGQEDYSAAADQFRRIIGDKSVPVSMAKLHAQRTIASRMAAEEGGPELDISIQPGNALELMLSYINEISPGFTSGKDGEIDPELAYIGLKTLAWECLKNSLRPQSVKRQEILTALGGDDAAGVLHYLIKQSSLIQVVGAARDSYRFTVEVLAEHLAAMHLVETCDGDEEAWAPLLRRLETLPSKQASNLSFLNALLICSDLNPDQVPDAVMEKLKSWTEPAVQSGGSDAHPA